MYGLAVLAGFGVSVAYLVPWSMVPDVIEYDEWITGRRREGVYYGFMVLLQKLGLALAVFLVGRALAAAGFLQRGPGEPIPEQPESALTAIRVVIGPLPAVALVLGVVCVYFYPITKAKHAAIVRALKRRAAAAGRG
jgi:glycoside/pentoside/hexuronide:cation symporter, GPH family